MKFDCKFPKSRKVQIKPKEAYQKAFTVKPAEREIEWGGGRKKIGRSRFPTACVINVMPNSC